MTTIAFKELYMLIQIAVFSFFADDLSVDMLYWQCQLSELENDYQVMLMNYSCYSPYGFALRGSSSRDFDVITISKIDICKCDKIIKNYISIGFRGLGDSNMSQKRAFQNSVMTLLWHLCQLHWWYVLCDVWKVTGLLIAGRFSKVLGVKSVSSSCVSDCIRLLC